MFDARIQKTISPTIAVHPNDTLEKVLGKLRNTHVHRLFVVDSETRRVLSVISLVDLLKHILNH